MLNASAGCGAQGGGGPEVFWNMPQTNVIYIGVHGSVLALDRATGTEIWRTKLKGDFVNAVIDQGQLYATTQGEVYRLDPGNGQIIWNNSLKGLGLGLVTIATVSNPQSVPMQEKQYEDGAAAGVAATTTIR
jgi:outer membrane protein assembly factor BamB